MKNVNLFILLMRHTFFDDPGIGDRGEGPGRGTDRELRSWELRSLGQCCAEPPHWGHGFAEPTPKTFLFWQVRPN